MGISYAQFLEMKSRTEIGKKSKLAIVGDGTGEPLEIPLHRKIMAWCDSQFPKWKYIRARSDRKSTIALGAQDFTIFASAGRTFCVEVKSSTGKLDSAQLIWKKEMDMNAHTVHLVQSMEDFERIVK